MIWRAEILVGSWSEADAARAKDNGVMVGPIEHEGEVVITCTWETDDVTIGAAMFELSERLRPRHELAMSDFGSVEQLAD